MDYCLGEAQDEQLDESPWFFWVRSTCEGSRTPMPGRPDLELIPTFVSAGIIPDKETQG